MSPKTKEQNNEIRQQSIQNIMIAALELFAHKGFYNTSVSQIAKEAGISKGLMYNYFKSKEELLQALVFNAIEEGEKMMDQILALNHPPATILQMIIDGSFQMVRSNLHYWKLMTSLAFQTDVIEGLREPLKKRQEIAYQQVQDLLIKMGSTQPKLDAYLFGAIMDGIFMHFITLGDDYPLDDMKAYVVNRFVKDGKLN